MEVYEGGEWMNLAMTGYIEMPSAWRLFLEKKVEMGIPDVGNKILFFVKSEDDAKTLMCYLQTIGHEILANLLYNFETEFHGWIVQTALF